MKMPKRAHIPGLTGPLHPVWLVWLKGFRDGSGQIRQTRDGYSSPYIERAYSSFDSAMNRWYFETARELEPLFLEAAHDVQESCVLRLPENMDVGTLSGEEAARQKNAKMSRQLSGMEREREIRIRLEELRDTFRTANEVASHYHRRVEALLKNRISLYWDGVLKAAGDGGLPPYPLTLTEPRGMTVREMFSRRIEETVSQIELTLHHLEEED